jgi:hypothetical protein
MFDYLLKKSPFHIPIFLIHSELNTYIKLRVGVSNALPWHSGQPYDKMLFSQGLIFSAVSHAKKRNSISCDSALGALLNAYLISTKRA